MTTSVQDLLAAFEALPAADQYQAAVEILRRVRRTTEGDVPDDTLTQAADDLFRALDDEEAGHAAR